VTLRLNTDTITYFKVLAKETGIPYQNLINLYLTEYAHSGKKLTIKWHLERVQILRGCRARPMHSNHEDVACPRGR